MKTPQPTAEGHHWRCCGCPWTGRSLQDAKAHLMARNAEGAPHYPFEAPDGATDVMSKVAQRIMLPAQEEGKVMVSAYATARKRLYAVLDPLVASLAARGGRLRGS